VIGDCISPLKIGSDGDLIMDFQDLNKADQREISNLPWPCVVVFSGADDRYFLVSGVEELFKACALVVSEMVESGDLSEPNDPQIWDDVSQSIFETLPEWLKNKVEVARRSAAYNYQLYSEQLKEWELAKAAYAGDGIAGFKVLRAIRAIELAIPERVS
jgi:hypothetical protein